MSTTSNAVTLDSRASRMALHPTEFGLAAFRPPHRQSLQQRRALWLADLAVRALVAEAMLTPKPALVDERGCGAHQDLDLHHMLRSAHALHASFFKMAVCAGGRRPDQALREQLGAIGRTAEQSMLAATNGSNSHRGAIWCLGLLIAARAMCEARASAQTVASVGARIAAFTDRSAPLLNSHGHQVCRTFGVTGAQGEARAGFPHTVQIGLPALWAARNRGADERCAQLDALMAVMSSLDDTCLLYRGGRQALLTAKAGAAEVLALGGTACTAGGRALLALDTQLLALNASPGGSADVLAACLFLDFMEKTEPSGA